MKLPSNIIIGPFDVTVEIMPVIEAEAQQLLGRFLSSFLRIEIWEGQSDQLKVDTLLHEVLHAIWSSCDLPKKASEEMIVTRLSTQLLLMFRQNPSLREIFFPDVREVK